MDLLNQNQYEQPKAPKGKKIIIALLILSILAVIAIIIAMVYLDSNKVIQEALFINNEQKEIDKELLYTDTQGNRYVSLKDLAELLGYEYDNSEYKKYDVATTKCYIKNENLITGFEQDSNKIYKYEEGTNLDYQYYTINNNIITYNDKLYIAMNDIAQALNCECTVNQNKEIRINSMEYLYSYYAEKLKDSGYSMASDQNSKKTLVYGQIMVSKNGLYGTLDTELKEIIGAKYTSMYFDEQNYEYIVSNSSGKYGILKYNGSIKESLKYDGLEILNYEHMLYKVKYNNKYGIMQEGTLLTEIIYDDIGSAEDASNKTLYTLIIPDIEGKIGGETIVVKQNNRYGLIYLKDGSTYLPCDHLEKLYSINGLNGIEYKIEAEKITLTLLEYLNKREMVILNLN